MHRRILFVACALLASVLFAGLSQTYAYDEKYPMPTPSHTGAGTACDRCHPAGPSSCPLCHFGGGPDAGKGPHGRYLVATKRCVLLPRRARVDGPPTPPGRDGDRVVRNVP